MQRNVKTLTLNILESQITTWALFAMVLCFVITYVYLVNSTVFAISERRLAEEESSALSSEVAQLESEYLALSAKIDLETAYALGFKDATKTNVFALREKDSAPASLSLAEDALSN